MKNDRLFQMMNILIEKGFVTAKELSERFDVSIRTVYRDIETLSVSGIPIYTTQGKGGGISLLEGYTVDRTLLSDKEQRQVLMALESVNAITGKKEDSSLEKLRNIFRQDIDNWIEIDFSSWEKSSSEKEIFQKIKDGILQRKQLKIVYHNSNGERTDRIVEPYKLIYKSNSWYLKAYCLMRSDERYFKVRRIEDISILDNKVQKKDISKKENMLSYEEKVQELKRSKIQLKIDKTMAFRVLDEFRDGDIVDKDTYYLVTTRLPDEPWVYQYLLGYGATLQVISPENVKQKMCEQINKMYSFYNLTC